MLPARYKSRKALGEIKNRDENEVKLSNEKLAKKSKGKRKRRTKSSPQYKPIDETNTHNVSTQCGYFLRERNANKTLNETKKATKETYQTVSDYYLKLQSQSSGNKTYRSKKPDPDVRTNKCDCQTPSSDDEDFCKSLKQELKSIAFHCRKTDSVNKIKKLAAEINTTFQNEQPRETAKLDPPRLNELSSAVPCLVPQYKWLYRTPINQRSQKSPSRSPPFLLSDDKFLLGFSTPRDLFGLGNADKPLFNLFDQKMPSMFASEDRNIFSEERFGGFGGSGLDSCPFEQDLQRDFQAGCVFEDRGLGFGGLSPQFPRERAPVPVPFYPMKFHI